MGRTLLPTQFFCGFCRMSRRFNKKSVRNALWLEANGRCANCGVRLPDGWDADHVVPWSKGGKTNFYNGQALCPKCNTLKGATMNWKDFFSFSSDFRSQDGQVGMLEIAAAADLSKKNRFFAELVTGYGKTLLAYGFFWVLHRRNLVDRMLVFVPRDDQRLQFCNDVSDARKLLGIKIGGACVVDKLSREFRYNREGTHQIFVATYQQLNDGYFQELMEFGSWMVTADECHHLPEKGSWPPRLEKIPRKATLYLSATPIRTDLQKLVGVPDFDKKVTYKAAYAERVVRRVRGFIEHYHLNIETNDGPRKITTEQLRAEAVVNFEKYEAKRQLRYNSSYLDWMLINPLRHLVERNIRHPGQHQMVIFAMSCRHAAYICDQINRLCVELEYDFKADWVGVGEGFDGTFKSSKENAAIMKAYRENRLSILVQVDKAGEGFNVKRASVLVFLHLVNADAKILQQIGRGIRRNSAIPFDEDDCAIYGSADTNLAERIRTMEQEAKEVDKENGRDDDDEEDSMLGPLFNIPDLTLIDARHDKTEHVNPDGVYRQATTEDVDFSERFGIPIEEVMRHYDRRAHRAGEAATATSTATADEVSDHDKMIRAQEQVKAATKTITGNILRILKGRLKEFNPALPGIVKTKINGQWNRVSNRCHDEMTLDEFRRKHAWLQEENQKVVKSREVPSWLSL